MSSSSRLERPCAACVGQAQRRSGTASSRRWGASGRCAARRWRAGCPGRRPGSRSPSPARRVPRAPPPRWAERERDQRQRTLAHLHAELGGSDLQANKVEAQRGGLAGCGYRDLDPGVVRVVQRQAAAWACIRRSAACAPAPWQRRPALARPAVAASASRAIVTSTAWTCLKNEFVVRLGAEVARHRRAGRRPPGVATAGSHAARPAARGAAFFAAAPVRAAAGHRRRGWARARRAAARRAASPPRPAPKRHVGGRAAASAGEITSTGWPRSITIARNRLPKVYFNSSGVDGREASQAPRTYRRASPSNGRSRAG